MGLFDSIIGSIGQNVDLANLAGKVGLTPEQAEAAISALARAHTQEGDTATGAAEETGIDHGVMRQIIDHLGGEGSLGEFARMLG